jgi:hypothetical protein
MATTVFDVVIRDIEEKRDGTARALIDGGARDYAEYRSMCGEIRGLSLAHSYVTDLVRRMEQDDDE